MGCEDLPNEHRSWHAALFCGFLSVIITKLRAAMIVAASVCVLEAEFMRCSCQNCGEYMVHDEKGLLSHCVCPNCFQTCSACLGTPQKPLSPDELQALFVQRQQSDGDLPDDGDSAQW